MPIQPGQAILNGKYHILRLIGEGGMARVWLAEEPRFANRCVAIKEPRSDLPPDDLQELRQRYRHEIELASQLDRGGVPNIVRAYTVEEMPEGAQLLVMEYMEGGSLADLMATHPDGLPVDRALAITRSILRALDAFHRLPMAPVHRDIKPANILLDARGDARLGDFGLAQLPGMSGRSRLLGASHPGTPMYMAPEQAASPQPLLPAADLYALACILFEMLTGQRYKRVRPGTKASDVRSDVLAWLDGVLAQALMEDPWDRYETAAGMAAALDAGDEAARQEAEGKAHREAEEKDRQEREERAHRKAEKARRAAEEPARRGAEEGRLREAPVWQQIGIEMVTIPAGEFLYGKKTERVYLPEYQLARAPVTNAQYEAFVDASGYRAPGHWSKGEIPEGKEDHPVVNVSWHDAQAFCEWTGCRLPAEQEWEKGARGTDGRAYPWGDGWEDGRCNSLEAGFEDTTPVDRYPNGASPYGLLDMAGNVWEWCEDKALLGLARVQRGGSWYISAGLVRCTFRDGHLPQNRSNDVGFRVASDPLG